MTIALAPLMEILLCPICREMVKVPFKQCRRGHLVCHTCAEPLRNCPTCKAAFSSEIQSCMKNLLEALPHVCRHKGNGCTEIVQMMDGHESFCGYRPTKCTQCDNDLPALYMKLHLENDHADDSLYKNNSDRVQLANFNESDYFIVSLFAMNNLFWLCFKRNGLTQTDIDIGFYGVFVGKPTDEYLITLKFEKDNIGHRVTLKASEGPSKCKNSTNEEEEEFSTKILCRVVKRCINYEGKLVFEYELTARPKSP